MTPLTEWLVGPAFRRTVWTLLASVVLLLLIVATVAAFWRIRPLAGVLLLPYLAWVAYALALNYRVWQLNPKLLG